MDIRPDELAYAAGYFDGEGSVSILTYQPRPGHWYHRLQVSVTSVDREPLLWLHERFDGWLGKHAKQPSQQRQAYRWTASDLVAENFLRQVRPWLIIKAERADVALAFRTLSHTRGYNKLPDGVSDQRQAFREQMLALNRRGLPDTEQEAE